MENLFDANYWNARYEKNETGWDIGNSSSPLKLIIDSIENKNSAILIPGAGNAYEADYLLEKNFNNITILDIAPKVIQKLKIKYQNVPGIKIVEEDFFTHNNKYDIILEQTFFCAISPTLRINYVNKMYELLNERGLLTGILFNKEFVGGPPFSGNIVEYENLFSKKFNIKQLEKCNHSIKPRENSEVIFSFQKK